MLMTLCRLAFETLCLINASFLFVLILRRIASAVAQKESLLIGWLHTAPRKQALWRLSLAHLRWQAMLTPLHSVA